MGVFMSKIFTFLNSNNTQPVLEHHDSESSISSNSSNDLSLDTIDLNDKIYLFNKTSKKRALLIGINYFNTNNMLRGCINDVKDLTDFLQKNLYFNYNDIFQMIDSLDKNSNLFPTCNNIKNEIKKLVSWANENTNSEIWLSYSGHGYFINDFNSDEIDNKDEVLCTVDGRYLKDDWLKENLIDKINDDVKLFILMDCCHSGTICDIQKEGLKNINKNIFMISGCKDNQTSADATFFIREEYEWRGALTYNFINNYTINLKEHYSKIINSLEGRFTQIPRISHTGLEENLQYFHLNS